MRNHADLLRNERGSTPTTTINFSLFFQLVDHRVEFSKWWTTEFKTVKIPVGSGTIFDVFIDTETKKFIPWTEMLPIFELDTDMPLQVRV